MKNYKVIIFELEEIAETKKDWRIIGQEPVEDSDFGSHYGNAEDFKGKLKDKYGYVDVEGVEKKEVEIYNQIVGDLDLSLVIKAVNGL